MRLDQLESLVGERCGVDGDLSAHAPGWMCEGLVRRHAAEVVARAAAERAAGPGEHEARDLVGRRALQALVEGRVLAVDRKDAAAAPFLGGERELARRDETLLVREREVDAVLERPERRVHAREADDGVQHDVGLRALEQRDEVAADLLQRRVDVVERRRAACGRAELEPWMRLDDLDRLAADRARGAEEGDPFHRSSLGPDSQATWSRPSRDQVAVVRNARTPAPDK